MIKTIFNILTVTILLLVVNNAHAQGADYNVSIFEPGVISLEGISEGSPSITSDGETLVFTRYQSYGDKVPYIAERRGDSWEVSRLAFADTLYNLAIAPDGQRIVYKTRNRPAPSEDRVNNAFRVDRNADGSWGKPVEMQENLSDAGYFRIAEDGTLYLFINASEGTPRGIFTSELKEDGSYSDPVWLSDAVSPYPSVTYSPVINSDETKIIVNRAGLSDEEQEKYGEIGLYIHQKYDFQWDAGTRLDLPYSWYSEVLPDGKIIFVDEGDLYEASLDELGISWN
jgi:hypothetical protein